MEGEDGAPMIGINAVEEKRNILNKLRRSDIFECVERRKKANGESNKLKI